MIPPVFAILKSATPVTALLGSPLPRVYRHGHAEQGVTSPYVAWSAISIVPANNISEMPTGDRVTLQVDCYSRDDAEIVALATAVRNAIEPYAHMTGVPIDQKEAETNLYRMSLQFDWFMDR